MQLPELFDLRHGQVVAGQVQDGIQQHGGVAVGEYEAIPVRPAGVGRVETQEVIPQDLGDVGHAHGGAGMAGIGLFNRVHAEDADGVG